MFTGLVDAIGTLAAVVGSHAGRELKITCSYEDLRSGESIAVNGACLTVRECGDGWFTVAAAEPTLQRTAIGTWTEGLRLNLERALRIGDRLGGHMVQGHVDAVGEVAEARMHGDVWLVDIRAPAGVREFLAPHGSVAVDGVSLTVNALPADGILQVAVVEFTRRHTTLDALRSGSAVHLEADVVAKYVRTLMKPYA